ncbi:hypothetical protein YQ22_16665 [Maribacter sp. 1_2014MBL_MicDiv]|nr:hypothetical protein YQ22_16665 [Maribacter sp. 1_2014MBL_MicDiv]
MLIKVTSFHVYSHQDNKVDTIENCSICELAVQNQNAEYTLVATFIFIFASVIIITEKKLIPFSITVPKTLFRYTTFGRPPPFQA